MFEIQIDSIPLHRGALILLDLALKSMVLMLLAFLATLALRPASAAIRHRVWALAFAGLMLLPVAAFLPDALQWKLVSFRATSGGTAEESQFIAPVVLSTDNTMSMRQFPTQRMSDESQSAANATATERGNALAGFLRGYLSWPLVLAIVWLLGACFHFAVIAYGWHFIRRLDNKSRPLRGARWDRLVDQLRVRLGVRQAVELKVSAQETVPMTWGIRYTVLVVPGSAVHWSQDQLESVILHELAHIRQHDLLSQFVAHAACALFWINPLAWYGFRRLRAEQEHACDDCVLNAGVRPSTYATHLVNLMESAVTKRLVTAVAFGGSSKLENRVRAIVDVQRGRSPVSSPWEIAIWGVAGVLTLGFVMVRTGEVASAQAPTATAKQLQAPPTAQKGQGYPSVPAELTDERRDEITLANLKAVMAAIHAYCDDNDMNLPPATMPNDALPPEKRLSGLVALLPYLDIDGSSNDQTDVEPCRIRIEYSPDDSSAPEIHAIVSPNCQNGIRDKMGG